MKQVLLALVFCVLVTQVLGDCYLHSLRGSVNRYRGDQNNNNRLFDSQNNNNGGYCAGPTMTFYAGSFINIEWTNQHGCGVTHKTVDCDIVLQYMCMPHIRDGSADQRPNANGDNYDQLNGNGEYVFGLHEPYEFYRKCRTRDRNKGLFTANRNVRNDATGTRQNNNGNQNGFECPEERDYYPYWHPTPWRDIAVYTSNPARCGAIQRDSQNVKDKFWCVDKQDTVNFAAEKYNNEKACTENDGVWEKYEAWNIAPPTCHPAGWNRDNHLGNGVTGFTNSYQWVLPSWSEVANQAIDTVKDGNDIKAAPCVFRIRYNISSEDYHGGVERVGPDYASGGFADYRMNKEQSPITDDPYVKFGKRPGIDNEDWELRLAIDTDQFGRVFQDRSHMFYIRAREFGMIKSIYNLMVRGKRGNIVQTYPATEYDFTPNHLEVAIGDLIHFQWTGCNTHNANQAGEGLDKTDRTNIVELKPDTKGSARTNYPKDFETGNLLGPAGLDTTKEKVWLFAYLNQYDGARCASAADTECCLTAEQLEQVNNPTQDVRNCALLNADGHEYFDGGVVPMTQAGSFHYMSSRNNNFTNRSQKGTIVVGGAFSVIALVAGVIGGVGLIGAGTVGVGTVMAQNGNAACANLVGGVN